MKNHISENISHLVSKSRCSQDEFGAIFDLKRGNISYYIKEKAQPKIETIQKICEHFNITIDSFINKSLNEISNNFINDPGEKYNVESKDLIVQEQKEIIELLKDSIKDKQRIIVNLENELALHTNHNKRLQG